MTDLWRVTYITSGLRRKSRTVTKEDLDFLQSAGHLGIRVTSYKRATEAQAKKGAHKGYGFQ